MNQPPLERDGQQGHPSSYEIVYPTTFDPYHIAKLRAVRIDAASTRRTRTNRGQTIARSFRRVERSMLSSVYERSSTQLLAQDAIVMAEQSFPMRSNTLACRSELPT